jgi:hypothetical protein
MYQEARHMALTSPHSAAFPRMIDKASIHSLIEDDLDAIVLPSQADDSTVPPPPGAPCQDNMLQGAAYIRQYLLFNFLNDASSRFEDFDLPQNERFRISSLGGDTHNGARRPLLLHLDPPLVLKFADPRPHLLLAELLRNLGKDLGIALNHPDVRPFHDYSCYLIRYFERYAAPSYDIDQYMFASGILIAVAYHLQFTDLHMENIVVADGIPVILDPECIFQCFQKESPEQRLLNTGLISRFVPMSAMRGGDATRHRYFTLRSHRKPNGTVGERMPVTDFRNRIREPSSQYLADPADYRAIVLAGFDLAFRWFGKHHEIVADIIASYMVDDFRIRFLYRPTRIYSHMIHRLNCSRPFDRIEYQKELYNRLKSEDRFVAKIGTATHNAEWQDLIARDIPYFWVNAFEPAIFHRTGTVQRLPTGFSSRETMLKNIRNDDAADFQNLVQQINDFLDADLNTP